MELDEKLRARLRELAERDPTSLDERQRARLRNVVEERAQKRAGSPLVWLTVPAFALGLGLVWLRVQDSATESAQGVRSEARQVSASAPAAPPACTDATPEAASFVAGRADEAVLELTRARLVKSGDSELRVSQLSPCELGLSLARGDVAVHARALAGGSLWIDSALGRVQVRGTIFSVQADERGMRVAVVEGRVAVEPIVGAREQTEVSLDQVLSIDPQGTLVRTTLSAAERARLLARLSLTNGPEPRARKQRPEQAVEAPEDAGPDAQVWHQGAVQGYPPDERAPGSSRGPDGRPMKKPTLIK